MNTRNYLAPVVLGVLAAGVLAATVAAQDRADEEAIREVVQLYFDGIIKYDEQALRKAFHADASVVGAKDDGTPDWEPFQEWVLYTRGKAPDATGRNNRIVSIDITGRAAVVKTDLDWPSVHYVDYLSLLKLDSQWKIVNKIWHREKPAKPAA